MKMTKKDLKTNEKLAEEAKEDDMSEVEEGQMIGTVDAVSEKDRKGSETLEERKETKNKTKKQGGEEKKEKKDRKKPVTFEEQKETKNKTKKKSGEEKKEITEEKGPVPGDDEKDALEDGEKKSAKKKETGADDGKESEIDDQLEEYIKLKRKKKKAKKAKEPEEEEEKEAESEEEVEIVEEEEGKAGYVVKLKPELDDETKSALRLREKQKKQQPAFRRQEWFRYKRLGESWRRPRGLHSKMRRNKKYRPPLVRVGYRKVKAARGLHPSGFEDILVYNLKELQALDPKTQAARIGGSVGDRKRKELQDYAEEHKIRVLNWKEVKK